MAKESQKEISRSGLSPYYQLSATQNLPGSILLLHMNGYDRQSAIRKVNTTFHDIGIQLGNRSSDDRITFRFGVDKISRREGDVNRDIFKYAAIFNPTSPIFDANGDYF